MDCLKAELIIATNMNCQISELKCGEKVAELLKEENFSPRWEHAVRTTLNTLDTEICHHALKKSLEWVKIWKDETPSIDVCETLNFFENDIILLKRENERLRALFKLERDSSFRMIRDRALLTHENDDLFEKFQKQKATIVMLQCINMQLSKMITRFGIRVDTFYENS